MTDSGREPYAAALASIERFRQRIAPAQEQEPRLAEIEKRLFRLSDQFHRLMEINRKLAEPELPKVHFNAEADMLEFSVGAHTMRLKLKRANADKPIGIGNSTAIGIYDACTDKPSSKVVVSLRAELEELLESYYYNAHRVQKLVTDLLEPKRKNKFECRPITMVRNQLVEHPRPELVYSFGYGTNGPVVRPMAKGEQREWVDSGLVPNTEAFDKALSEAFDGAAVPTAVSGPSALGRSPTR